MSSKSSLIHRGQAITFRLPSDTPDHIIKQLQKLKETERRNFSSTIASFALEGVSQSLSKQRETLTIPLPKSLSKEQRNWLKHSHSEALLGSIVYQLLADPVRATTILASLNSKALDINEALYLQENEPLKNDPFDSIPEIMEDEHFEEIIIDDVPEIEDDLMNFEWEKAQEELAASKQPEDKDEENLDDLLGDFLAMMNK